MEVNYEKSCYFTINFKNNGHEINEMTNSIHYDGQYNNDE